MQTRTVLKTLFLALFTVLSLVACSKQPVAVESSGSIDSNKLDTYLSALNENQKMMTAVYVTQNGETLYEFYSGFTSIERNISLSSDTQFRIGSITKTFTATLIMQLIEEGKLSLSTTLEQFYPDVPNADAITVQHLLSHRSGIHSFTDEPVYLNYMTKPQTRKQMEQRIESYKPLFAPDSRHQYSNSNYALLGFIVETLYEKPFAAVVAENISTPLALEKTYFGSGTSEGEDEASSYRFNGGWQLQPETHLSVPHAAGAMVSTARETNAFIYSLFANELISEDSLNKMMSLEDGYGLGLFAMPFYGKTFYGHNGSIDGFVSNAAFNPMDGIAITVLSNGVNFKFNDVLIAVLSHIYDKDFDALDFSRAPIELTSEKLEQLTGLFSSEAVPLDIRISINNQQLVAQATGQNALPLTPYSETEFRFEPAGIVIQFDPESLSNGKLDQFRLNQGGGEYLFQRN